VNLAWNAVTDTGRSGLKGYNIYRNNTFVKQLLAPATSTSDGGLAQSTVYSYAVSAVDQAGNQSARCTAVTTNTPACPSVGASIRSSWATSRSGRLARRGARSGERLAFLASDEFDSRSSIRGTPPPVGVGGADQPFYGDRVAKAGNVAVVGSSRAGLRIFDVSTPSRPQTLGSLGGSVRGVAMSADGTAAYLRVMISGNPGHIDLLVVDLRTPSAPRIVAQTFVAGGSGVAVSGSYLYVGAGTDGLLVYDLTQPLAPVLRGSVQPASGANVVVAANGYAYTTSGTSVLVIDARTPSTPRVVGSYPFSAQALAISGTRLYAMTTVQLTILDVSNPAGPALLGTSTSYAAQGIAASGTMLYLASPTVDRSRGDGGLYIVDAAAATAPTLRGHLLGGLENEGLAVAGSLAVATGRSIDGGLQVLNVQNPAAPRVLAKLAGAFKGVAMTSTAAYARITLAGNPGHTDLMVIDLRTPAAPTIASQIFLPGGSGATVVGSLLYVAAGSGGLQVYDIASPLSPRLLGTATLASGANAVAAADGYAYVTSGSTIAVVDARNPGNPAAVGSYPATGLGLAAAGGRLYVVNSSQLLILNVTNPAAPSLLQHERRLRGAGRRDLGDVCTARRPGGLAASGESRPLRRQRGQSLGPDLRRAARPRGQRTLGRHGGRVCVRRQQRLGRRRGPSGAVVGPAHIA
jgi:hypothetical protein